MAIPSSGPISMSMFNTELSRSFNTTNSELAKTSTPTSNSLFYLAGQSGSLNQVAPNAMSEWYGYIADPAASNLTFTIYSAGSASFDLSKPLRSTAVTISAWSVTGYTEPTCTTTSGDSDNQDANIVIAIGTTNKSGSGAIIMTNPPTTRYKRGTSITVNGTARTNGQTLVIGGTTVSVVISSACNLYSG